LINTVYHLLLKIDKGRGGVGLKRERGLIDFLSLKREVSLERAA